MLVRLQRASRVVRGRKTAERSGRQLQGIVKKRGLCRAVMFSSSSLRFFKILAALTFLLGAASSDEVIWRKLNELELEAALKPRWNNGVAKNVVLFIGDGMGPNTITASRIYSEGEGGSMSFEKFPHLGLLKTYSANTQVPDSASTATALMCGEKVNYKTLGVSSRVKKFDCPASLKPENRLKSIATLGQEAGKSTGFVTTTRVTHATPSGLYAHSPSREWECESVMPNNASACKDIARQLVEDEPGRNLNVILGGGRQTMMTGSPQPINDPIDTYTCQRKDGRDLIKDWSEDKEKRKVLHKYVTNSEELLNVDYSKTDYLLGIFSNSHLKYEIDRDKGPKGSPSLQQMTEVALKILSKNNKGFILMVEGGLIDLAHHRTLTRKALDETVELNKAVNATLQTLKRLKMLEETLIIVTSDHSHTLTINGYPDIGNSILGIASASLNDGVPYTTLSYGTVGPSGYHYNVSEDGKVVRQDPSKVNTLAYDYSFQGAIVSNENHHGGSDVLVYAQGPMAHLIHSVHEQSYIAKVITYAAAIGSDSRRSKKDSKSNGVCSEATFSLVLVITFAFILKTII